MGGELVEDSSTSSSLTYEEVFEHYFPYYLSIGMSYREYWEMDVDLVKAYKKAEEIRFERKNREMWIQGMYVYEAVADVSPILHAFAKKGTKVRPYMEKPIEFEFKKKKPAEEESNSKENIMLQRMQARMAKINARFKNKSKEVNTNG